MFKEKYIISIFLLLCMNVQIFSQKLVTREQLLRLFYQAQQAQRKGEKEEEATAYKKIITLSPRLPEPYLRLGDILKSDIKNLKSQKKALLAYGLYMKLNPGVSDSVMVSNKIEEVKLQISRLEEEIPKPILVSTSEGQVTQDNIIQKRKSEVLQDRKKVDGLKSQSQNTNVSPEKSKIVEHKKSTIEQKTSATDNKLQEDSKIESEVKEETIVKSEKDIVDEKNLEDDSCKKEEMHNQLSDSSFKNVMQKFTGRWVSDSKGINAREAWIMDIKELGEDVLFSLSDQSAIKSTSLFNGFTDLGIKGKIEGTKLILDFSVSGSQPNKDEGSLMGTVGALLENTFGLDVLDFGMFSENKSKDRELIYTYIFKLDMAANCMKGNLRTLVKDKADTEVVILDNLQDCELYRAPSDYKGMDFVKISDDEKSDSKSFRQLFQTTQKQSKLTDEAMNNLGCLYWSGIGTEVNMKKAMKCFTSSALHDRNAQLNMALLYLNGLGVKKDVNKARNWFLSAADKGYTDAYVLCGDTYLFGDETENNYDIALFYYDKAINAGSAFGFYRLGWLYKEGLGVQADDRMALFYLKKAVDAGYVAANYEVASIYEKQGNQKDALRLIKEAAIKKDVQAISKLSECYLRGNGVEQNFIRAKALEKKALIENEQLIFGYNTVKPEVMNAYKQIER